MILIATPVHIQVGSMYIRNVGLTLCASAVKRFEMNGHWTTTTIVDVVVVVVGEEWKAQGSVELFVISRRGVRRLLTSYPILSSAYTYCCVLLSEWVGGWLAVFLSLSSIVINVVRRYCLKWCNATIVKRLRVCFTYILCFNAVKTAGFAKW